MARKHNPSGIKGAKHLSQRDLPFVSVISNALNSITDDGVSPTPSDDPLPGSGTPTPSVPLQSDPPLLPDPVSISIPDSPLQPLLPPLAPSDTNSSSVSTDSILTSSDTDSTSSASSSQPSSTTSDSNSTTNSTPNSPSLSSPTSHLTSSPTPTNSRQPLPSAFVNTGSSTITEVFTTTSGSLTLAITTTIAPSLSSNPGSESSFFKDKGQAAAVLTVAILVGILGFGFLGYRFVKTVKNRQVERDLQEASRLNRSRAILDDGEDDAFSTDHSMRQTNSSIWSAFQAGPLNDSSFSDRRVGSTKSASTTLSDPSVGHSSFERALRGRVSSEEDDAPPVNANGSTFQGPTNGFESSERFTTSIGGPVVLDPAVSASGRNPFLVRREDIQPPTPPVLPDSFGEDVPTPNPISSPASVDAFYLRQRNLKITNE